MSCHLCGRADVDADIDTGVGTESSPNSRSSPTRDRCELIRPGPTLILPQVGFNELRIQLSKLHHSWTRKPAPERQSGVQIRPSTVTRELRAQYHPPCSKPTLFTIVPRDRTLWEWFVEPSAATKVTGQRQERGFNVPHGSRHSSVCHRQATSHCIEWDTDIGVGRERITTQTLLPCIVGACPENAVPDLILYTQAIWEQFPQMRSPNFER